MKEELTKRRKELEKERDLCLWQSHSLKLKADRIIEELKQLNSLIDIRELIITDHAFDRFRERVMDLPTKKIRQMLTGNDLTEAYRRKGDGRYGVKEMPHVLLHIKDFAIVTVINTNDVEERLMALKEYMNYYVDELVLKHTGLGVKIMKFKTFKNLYFRNQVPRPLQEVQESDTTTAKK